MRRRTRTVGGSSISPSLHSLLALSSCLAIGLAAEKVSVPVSFIHLCFVLFLFLFGVFINFLHGLPISFPIKVLESYPRFPSIHFQNLETDQI